MKQTETLTIWKETVHFAQDISDMAKTFPRFEVFNLGIDLTRAATTIPLNVVEGANQESSIELRRFILKSFSSLDEVRLCLEIAQQQKYISKEAYTRAYAQCERLSQLLSDFSRSLTQRSPSLN